MDTSAVDFSNELNNSYSYQGLDIDDEEITGEDRIISPFDPTQIRVETKPMTIDLLVSRMSEGEIDLAPDFQRKGGIWKAEAQSRLIESILIRIPLPAFYMDATNDDRWVVVDGLQRLTTLKRFMLDKSLRLSGLEFLTHLHGKSYDDLPRNLQRRILETQVTVYLVARGTPDEVKFNIFKRINTGGLPLSAQEIRHALHQGKVTTFLKRLAGSPEFKQATANGVSDDRMADREFVLRFLAFTLTPYTAYKVQDFDKFLNDAMVTMNKMSDAQLAALERQFLRSMRAAADIFGNDAFRKRYKSNDARYQVNKPLFEVWSVNLNNLNDDQLRLLKKRKEPLKKRFMRLMNDDRDFETAISYGTGDVTKIRLRFGRIEQIIQEVLA